MREDCKYRLKKSNLSTGMPRLVGGEHHFKGSNARAANGSNNVKLYVPSAFII